MSSPLFPDRDNVKRTREKNIILSSRGDNTALFDFRTRCDDYYSGPLLFALLNEEKRFSALLTATISFFLSLANEKRDFSVAASGSEQ